MSEQDAKEVVEKVRPLLQERNDALDFLFVSEEIFKEYADDKLWGKFSDKDYEAFAAAVNDLRNALLGQKDEFGILVKEHVPLDQMHNVKKAFEDRLARLAYQAKDYFRTKLLSRQATREERLEKSVEAYKDQLVNGKTHKSKPWKRHPDSPEADYSKDDIIKVKETPAPPRAPSKSRTEQDIWLKVAPVISEMVRMPSDKNKQVGEKPVDDIVDILDENLPLETFLEKAHRKLPRFYEVEGLDDQIKNLKEEISSAQDSEKDRLKASLFALEKRHNDITKMDGNLKFLHDHWIPMETKSNLNKVAADVSSIIKPNTRGPSAEEEKQLVTVLAEWLAASNIQGSEEDIEKKVAEYLVEKAPQYVEENVQRVARKVYAEWVASKRMPSEVGQEGKANVGVANSDGTGVFVEPNRGNSNVQNEAPTSPITKEAKDQILSFRKESELVGEVKTSSDLSVFSEAADGLCTQCDLGAHERCYGDSCTCGTCKSSKKASLMVVAYVEHVPGHKNSKGEEAPWVIKSHKTHEILSSHKTESEAKHHLQQMEQFKHMKGSSQESKMIFNAGDNAVLNTSVGALPEGTEVVITDCNDAEVAFTSGNILGITKVANLDKVAILKEAASDLEKYPWENEGLSYKYQLGDRVKVGTVELNGESYKGELGTVREKVILAANDGAEEFYLVELDCGGNVTLPEEALSKAGKMSLQKVAESIAPPSAVTESLLKAIQNLKQKNPEAYTALEKEFEAEIQAKSNPSEESAALNAEELKKEAVIKPNFDAVQEFLNSYDHQPTVVTTADIEEWMADPKNNYQYSKKDLKEFVKYLQSAHVEVRVPVKKEAPEILPEEAAPSKEFTPPKELKKEAVKYKYTSPDGKQTIEKEITEDMGNDFETEDPSNPGQKMKWTRSSLDVCAKCAGVGSLPCSCMDDELWLSVSCAKCKDEGATPCPACRKV